MNSLSVATGLHDHPRYGDEYHHHERNMPSAHHFSPSPPPQPYNSHQGKGPQKPPSEHPDTYPHHQQQHILRLQQQHPNHHNHLQYPTHPAPPPPPQAHPPPGYGPGHKHASYSEGGGNPGPKIVRTHAHSLSHPHLQFSTPGHPSHPSHSQYYSGHPTHPGQVLSKQHYPPLPFKAPMEYNPHQDTNMDSDSSDESADEGGAHWTRQEVNKKTTAWRLSIGCLRCFVFFLFFCCHACLSSRSFFVRLVGPPQTKCRFCILVCFFIFFGSKFAAQHVECRCLCLFLDTDCAQTHKMHTHRANARPPMGWARCGFFFFFVFLVLPPTISISLTVLARVLPPKEKKVLLCHTLFLIHLNSDLCHRE